MVGWTIAFVVGLSLVYGLYPGIPEGKLLSINVAAFYAAVSRPVWTFCLTWIVVACSKGYGGTLLHYKLPIKPIFYVYAVAFCFWNRSY